MILKSMSNKSKIHGILLTLNAWMHIWLLSYFFRNSYNLFIILLSFLVIERTFILLRNMCMISVGFDKLKRMIHYFLLWSTFMDWKSDGFECEEYYIDYSEFSFYKYVKKHAQFLNSVPLILIFYNLCQENNNVERNYLFLIVIIYSSIVTGYLLNNYYYDNLNQDWFKKSLYLLIYINSIYSYMGLLGQLFFNSPYLGIAVLLAQIIFPLFLVSQSFSQKIYMIWKQLFLVAHIDSLQFINYYSNKESFLYQAIFHNITHIFMVIYKILCYQYINDYDLFLYIGSSIKAIDIVLQFIILYQFKKYGPHSIQEEIVFSEDNMNRALNKKIMKKFARYYSLKINMKHVEQQYLRDSQFYSILLKFIDSNMSLLIRQDIILEFNEDIITLNRFNQDQEILITQQNRNNFFKIIEIAIRLSQNMPLQNKLSQYSQKYILIHLNQWFSLYQQLQKFMQYLDQPLNCQIKTNIPGQIEFIDLYNLKLQTQIIQILALQNQMFQYIDINPTLIIYDLLEESF